jgi:hypothetical protein
MSVALLKDDALFAMAGHSRPKDGVASARQCPGRDEFLHPITLATRKPFVVHVCAA